jgi:hypothetical protein
MTGEPCPTRRKRTRAGPDTCLTGPARPFEARTNARWPPGLTRPHARAAPAHRNPTAKVRNGGTTCPKPTDTATRPSAQLTRTANRVARIPSPARRRPDRRMSSSTTNRHCGSGIRARTPHAAEPTHGRWPRAARPSWSTTCPWPEWGGATNHCGGVDEMIEGSPDVTID